MSKSLNDIEEIKKEYGKVVTDGAIFNLLNLGISSYEELTLSEFYKTIEIVFEELNKQKRRLPVTKEYLKNIATCQMNLKNINPIEIMTYFSKPTKKEDNE